MLDALLGSKTRSRVLAALLTPEGRRMRLRELVREVGTSVSSVQNELERLEALNLIRSERVGDARYLSAVESHPFTAPLREMLAIDAAPEVSGPATSPLADRVNPLVRPHIEEIADACRKHGALKAALVGSATQTDGSVIPADLDVLVTFDPGPEGLADRYFGLLAELERIMGMPVEIIEEPALENPYLRAEFDATQVVLYEAA